MFNTGMMEGPSVEGKWYNKRTGQTITVRDMMMSDEGMQVFTTDGQLIDGEIFSRDYIQCDDTVYDADGNVTGSGEPVDYEAMFGTVDPVPTNIYTPSYDFPVEQPKVSNKKFEMLDSLFAKLDNVPDVNCSISWKKIPKSELKMLKTYFDITDKDIAEYIYLNFCSAEQVQSSIEAAIVKLIVEKEK